MSRDACVSDGVVCLGVNEEKEEKEEVRNKIDSV